ncbi:phage tail sheath subtilisin-like domain-containing protein [Streptomyces sp. UNOC14_S4]|uniref:phage tail sheath subtilisin-like domain-containing protein n=1 Tax=Streptomyces sp. UNOC14_S4 TaxID=2872340 RepID=UPI001E4D4DB8|nr:phage tail sheath subtilisin-like domain-containing protein [Streptomyces sp. UNOC14_S4]MCC3766042.1 phage tail sheath subtilisin-like domain-containing protein [Streptomyces sp. UNOC14_S4]
MANYRRPGIFVDETLTPILVNDAPAGDFVSCFVGEHTYGPSTPTLVRNWADFVTIFGGFGNSNYLLPFAVHQYFSNGGRAAYVVRGVAKDAKTSQLTLKDRQTPATPANTDGDKTKAAALPADTLRLTAKAAGSYGNSISVSITDSNTGLGRFNLWIKVGGDSASNVVERFNDITTDPADSRNVVAVINSPTTGSKFLTAEYLNQPVWKADYTPVPVQGASLAGGDDGAATPDLVAAAKLLEETGQALNINLPGVSDASVLNPIIDWIESYGYGFLVVDAPKLDGNTNTEQAVDKYLALSPLSNKGTSPAPLRSSSYVAVYGPWISTADPAVAAVGATRLLPPGGAVMGKFADFDIQYGPHRTPAGPEASLKAVYAAQYRFIDTQLDALNQAGINIIRQVPNTGFCVMGGRTVRAGYPDRYIAVRRFLIHVRKILVESTQFAIFQPNTPDLWASLSAIVTQRLTEMTQTQMLKGATPDQAFRVVCDSTNNTAVTVANGEVHIDIGLALARPAEFIGVHIGQFEGGSTSTDSL